MRDLIRSVILALLACAVAPRVMAALPASGPHAVVDAFIRAWNAHDMKALGELFTEDADYVTAEGKWWKGRTWIQSQLERAHAAKLKTTMMVETNTTVRTVRPDVAVMHFEWEVSGELGADGKPLITRHGILHIVAVKQSGGWRIVSAQDTATMPPV
jgi:uncharacterized protein (TIGR02246 family)